MSQARLLLALAMALAAAALAIVGYRVLHPSGPNDAAVRDAIARFSDPKQETHVERLLASAAQTGPDRLRAQAASLLASLLIHAHGRRELAEAEQLYTTAVRLDPTDETSKFDLELLLARQDRRRSHHAREQRAPKTATTKLRSQPGGTGAAAKRSQYGY
jgi:hypothetical protein